MQTIRCPLCSTPVTVAPGARPVCPSCGHTGRAPPPVPAVDPFASFATNRPVVERNRYGNVPRLRTLGAPTRARPSAVTTGTVIGLVAGAFMALGGAILLLVGPIIMKAIHDQALAEAGRAILVTAGLVKLLFAAGLVAFATLALQGLAWARTVLVVLLCLDGAACLYGAVRSLSLVNAAWVVLDGVAVALLLGSDASAWYRSKASQRGRRSLA